MILSAEKLRARVRFFLQMCGYTEVRHAIHIEAHEGIVSVKNFHRPRPAGAGSVGSHTPTVSAEPAGRLTVGMR